MTRQEETIALKVALKTAGLQPTRVRHGTGTAWGWLRVWLEAPSVRQEETRRAAEAVIRRVTGRGDLAMERVIVEVC